MPLSSAQKGAIGQFAFLAAALATGNGQVEVYTPAADNEGRDAEVRRHLRRTPGIGIQVKVAFMTVRITPTNKQNYLEIRFTRPKASIQNDPRFWYFLAVYDWRQLKFLDPVFVVPSQIFHRMARNGTWQGRANFEMVASLGPASHDRWAPYRVAVSDLGKRLLDIVDNGGLTVEAGSLPLPAGAIVLGRAGRRRQSARRLRAA